jgi:hypothetical protein
MSIALSVNLDDGVWTLSQRRVALLDAEDFAAWRNGVLRALSLLDRPVDLLVDLAGLTLHPSIAPAYALVLLESPRTRSVYYYGAGRATTAALKLAYAFVRLHPDRDAALAALEDDRAGRRVVRQSGTIPKPSDVKEMLRRTAR